MTTIPPAPPCAPWCTAEHEEPGGWDSIIRNDAAKWCTRVFRVHLDNAQQIAYDLDVTVQRFADSGKDGLTAVDPPLIELAGLYLTPEEAARVQRALRAAALIARTG